MTTQTPFWPPGGQAGLGKGATICGNTSPEPTSTSKKATGTPALVTRKRWPEAGWSGLHCTPSATLPEAAWANHSPGGQLLVREIDTDSVRAHDWAVAPLYCRHTRVSVAGVATVSTWQPL